MKTNTSYPSHTSPSKVLELLDEGILLADDELLLVVPVEIAVVPGTAAGRHEARHQRPVVDLQPVDLLEPAMPLDVHRSTLEVAEAPGQVELQEILEEVLEILAEEGGTAVLALGDLLVDLHGVLGVEGRVAGAHLVDEDAVAPPVDALAVALGQDYLGGQVLGRAAERPGPVGGSNWLFL